MPSAARLREASTYSRPDFAARRRRWSSRPTRGTAIRTLFEHVAGPAGEDGAPGDVLLRAARDPVDRTTTDVPDSDKNAGFGPSR